MKNYLKLGDWNALCDVCGFKFKASMLQKRWDGAMVCASDWETRHPQDFLRVRKERISVPWTRPDVSTPVSEGEAILTELGLSLLTEALEEILTEE